VRAVDRGCALLHAGKAATFAILVASVGGTAGVQARDRSEIQFVDANDTPQVILDKTRINGFVNLHLGWRSASEKVFVNLFARDITNKRALVSFPDFTPYFATLQEYSDPTNHIYLTRYTPPRTFGVTFTVRY
jgi:hypothetical protein